MRRLLAQTTLELKLTLRRGESLLVTIGIPVGILAFFTLVDVLPHPGRAIDFLTPGVIALAVISSAMTNLSIATGFERHAGVLRRLGTTPLGKGGLLTAKVIALLLVVAVQVAVVIGTALALDWHPSPNQLLEAFACVLVGVIAFAGIGFLLAGRLRAETNLAVANGLFLIFLLFGGIVVPLDRLPPAVADLARYLPAWALTTSISSAFDIASPENGRAVITLLIWAVLGSLVAVRSFRWD